MRLLEQRKLAIIVAAVLGLAAVILTNVYFRRQDEIFRRRRGKETPVLVAAEDISGGTTIDYDMLAIQAMPENFIQPGALTSKESAVGKTALATIVAGEQVLPTKLTTPGTGLTLALKTPPGKRAVTIALRGTSAVGGMVSPGDYVDVLAIFTTPAVILTLFQDILVLAVGQEMVPAGEGRRRRTEMPSATEENAITLALSPQEVQILTVAMQHGEIRLTLRPRSETGKTMRPVDLSNLPPAIDLNTLLILYTRPIAAPEPEGVEVIRGLEKEITPLPAKE